MGGVEYELTGGHFKLHSPLESMKCQSCLSEWYVFPEITVDADNMP